MTSDARIRSDHAASKINLALHVTGQRPDGYHLLESLAVFTVYGDLLSVSPAAEDAFLVEGPFASDVPIDGGNLVIAAREKLRALHPDRAQPVSIMLEKNLPVASGIGGGSSDAAAALRLLCRQWGIAVDARVSDIALELGADVPMCLASRPLIARGIGEALEPVANLPALSLVLVNPGVAVATRDVFGRLARRDNAPLPPLPQKLDLAALLDWLRTTRNDLEAPAVAIAPAIREALDALQQEGAAFFRMSGSGATCFGIFPDQAAAERAARAIRGEKSSWFVAATSTLPQES